MEGIGRAGRGDRAGERQRREALELTGGEATEVSKLAGPVEKLIGVSCAGAAALVAGGHPVGGGKFPNGSWASRGHKICFGAWVW